MGAIFFCRGDTLPDRYTEWIFRKRFGDSLYVEHDPDDEPIEENFVEGKSPSRMRREEEEEDYDHDPPGAALNLSGAGDTTELRLPAHLFEVFVDSPRFNNTGKEYVLRGRFASPAGAPPLGEGSFAHEAGRVTLMSTTGGHSRSPSRTGSAPSFRGTGRADYNRLLKGKEPRQKKSEDLLAGDNSSSYLCGGPERKHVRERGTRRIE